MRITVQKIKFNKIISSILGFSILFSLHNTYCAEEYKGKVVSLNIETLMFGTDAPLMGYINYVPRLGQIITPSIIDETGKTIQQGTVLAIIDLPPWIAQYKQAVANASIDKNLVDLAWREHLRYTYLAKTNAVGYENLANKDIALYNAIGSYKNAIASVYMYKEQLDASIAIAPFEGIVTKLYFPQGQACNRPPIADIVQLNPIGVEIVLPPDKLYKLTRNTKIKVISKNLNKEFQPLPDFILLLNRKLTIAIPNYQILEENKILDFNSMPAIREWAPVKTFSPDSRGKVLSIAEDAIVEENGEFFVCKAKGQKVMDSNKNIEHVFTIEKVKIQPAEETRYRTPYEKVRALRDPGTLELNDIVVKNPSSDMKNGQKVCYPDQRYLLMPGDEVSVIIGDGAVLSHPPENPNNSNGHGE